MHSKVGTSALIPINQLDDNNHVVLAFPYGAKVLSVTQHDRDKTLWVHYLYDEDRQDPIEKEFFILSAFGALPDNDLYGWKFLGSFVVYNLSYHVFVRVI